MAFEIAKAGWLQRLSTVLKRWKKNWVVLYTNGDLKYFESPDSHVAEDVIVMRAECLGIKTGVQITDVAPPEGHMYNRNCLIVVNGRNNKNWIMCAESSDDMKAWQMALEQSRVVSGFPAGGSQSAPPAYSPAAGVPPAYPGVPPAYTGVPPTYTGVPPTYTGVPPTYPGPTAGSAYPRQSVTYAYPGQTIYSSPSPGAVVYQNGTPGTTVYHQGVPSQTTVVQGGVPGQTTVVQGGVPGQSTVYQQAVPGQTRVVYVGGRPRYYRRGYDGTDMAMGVVAGAALGSMMWGPCMWW